MIIGNQSSPSSRKQTQTTHKLKQSCIWKRSKKFIKKKKKKKTEKIKQKTYAHWMIYGDAFPNENTQVIPTKLGWPHVTLKPSLFQPKRERERHKEIKPNKELFHTDWLMIDSVAPAASRRRLDDTLALLGAQHKLQHSRACYILAKLT